MTINIDKAFSKISNQYEVLDKTSSLIKWMRNRVRKSMLSHLKSNDTILEINCGTGLDAVFFANKGYRIHATDVAKGMIAHVETKIITEKLENKLSCEVLSYNNLNSLEGQKYDHIFSNFGGLNCCSEQELKRLFQSFKSVLKVHGKITLVIMPKICIWEILKIFKGNNHAFRRMKKNGTMANISGEKVHTYYHSSKKIKSLLLEKFEHIKVENVCFLGPTSNHPHFRDQRPFLFKIVKLMDLLSNKIFFLKGIGDYYIISARKK